MRREAKALLVLAVTCALVAVGAGSAAADYTYKGLVGAEGDIGEAGILRSPSHVAVESSTGNVFVADTANNRIQVFEPRGSGNVKYLTQFGNSELSEPSGIAVAEAGGETFVYVADTGNDQIVKYVSDGEPTPAFATDPSFTSPSKGSGSGEVGDFRAALAIDPLTDDLLVADYANKLIQRFEADGTFLSSFDGSNGGSAFAGPIDLAVNSSGDVYVVDANGDIVNAEGTSKALRYSAAGEYKATLEPVGSRERPARVAVNLRNDEVVVSGDQDAGVSGPEPFIPILQRFDAANQPLPSPLLEPSEPPLGSRTAVGGLAIGSDSEDHLYVVLRPASGGFAQIQSFSQPVPSAPAPPDVLAQNALPTSSEATLSATIDTRGSDTEFRFEWGPTPAYGMVTSARQLPNAVEPVTATSDINGLVPDATYHFRVVASNSSGTTTGPDRTFAVLRSGDEEDTCPNSVIRGRQGVALLPDCRAYEMASPVDKNGNDVSGFNTIRTSPDGERVAYFSSGGFPGSPSATALSTYMSFRGAEGWSTRPLNLPQTNTAKTLGIVAPAVSEDLRTSYAYSNLALTPGATKGAGNIFLQDILSGALTYRGQGDDFFYGEALDTDIGGIRAATQDLGQVILETKYRLVPEAPLEEPSVYEVSDAGVKLVSILPNGVPASATVGNVLNNPTLPEKFYLSSDGKRVVFHSGGRLYQRIDGNQTIELSAPAPSGEATLPTAEFGAATPDGKVVFFTAKARLTADGTPGIRAPRLYRYEAGNLQYIAEGPQGGGPLTFITVLSATPDGKVVYFTDSEGEVHRWSEEDGVTDIGQIPSLGVWRMSPDGRYVAFEASDPLTPTVRTGPACPGPRKLCLEVFVFDSTSGNLTCASCSPVAAAPKGRATLGSLFRDGPSLKFGYHLPRGITNDGTMYFDSSDRLTGNDTDSTSDVYEWDEHAIRLLTPGTVTDVVFADASADGSTVFVLTGERLVSGDKDTSRDVYAIRRGGGIPAQNPLPAPPPCDGEGCQGAASLAPPATTLGSQSVRRGKPQATSEIKLRASARAVIHGVSGTVKVKSGAAGKVRLIGSGLKASSKKLKPRTKTPIRAALKGDARRRLQRTGRLEVHARLRFRPVTGSVSSRTIDLIFISRKGR